MGISEHLFQEDIFSAPSHTWHSLLEGYRVVREGWEWCVRDSKKYKFWLDPWLGDQRLMEVTLPPLPQVK